MRLWYLRRAVPWAALSGCGVVAVALVATARRWPETSGLVLPYALVACAAAAGFLMDESSASIVGVTARGGAWRLLARLSGVVLPAILWVALVVAVGDEAASDTRSLVVAGLAACLLGAGTAALLHRTGIGQPGGLVAGALVGVATGWTVLGGLFGWQPLLPVHDAPSWVPVFWAGVGGVAVLAAVAGLRRTP
jgi:hypothetical protein